MTRPVLVAAPTDAHGRTAAARAGQRELAAAEAAWKARLLVLTDRCRFAFLEDKTANLRIGSCPHHQMCRGESPGGAGCLCPCHDPVAEVVHG